MAIKSKTIAANKVPTTMTKAEMYEKLTAAEKKIGNLEAERNTYAMQRDNAVNNGKVAYKDYSDKTAKLVEQHAESLREVRGLLSDSEAVVKAVTRSRDQYVKDVEEVLTEKRLAVEAAERSGRLLNEQAQVMALTRDARNVLQEKLEKVPAFVRKFFGAL